MKVGLLTSSRADFGIYLPLIKKLYSDTFFDLEIIAFGTHLSEYHGITKAFILEQGFDIKHEIQTTPKEDTSIAIALSIADTILKFAEFWDRYRKYYDVVFCLGDRYEMFAAVSAGIPFNINFAHLHSGETTLGAFDNVFRHCITHASKIHFTSTEKYTHRVLEMLDTETTCVNNVGALSLDTLINFESYSLNEFKFKWKVDFANPTILLTFHPETVDDHLNDCYAHTICNSVLHFANSGIQFLLTMPNADTSGNLIRTIFLNRLSDHRNVFIVENLGTKGYFSAMKYCKFLLGNTSSGIIEAASFFKYVINIGNRQKGRDHGENVLDVQINEESINTNISQLLNKGEWKGDNIYFQTNAAGKIIDVIKNLVLS